MSFTNLYKPPHDSTPNDVYGPDPYDINFIFPLRWEALENDVVKLTPFVPRSHGALYWSKFAPDRIELTRHLPWAHTTLEAFLACVEKDFRSDPNYVLLAVVDKTRAEEAPGLGGAIAGLIGFVETSKDNLRTEVGPVLTLRAYQRTHVTANAAGLLLHYAFGLPSDSLAPGLGLRRVQWTVFPGNEASARTAKGLGFKEEGVMRWKWILPEIKEGKEPRAEDPVRGKGRDTIMFAICWDDWENAVDSIVKQRMAKSRDGMLSSQ